MYNIYYLNDARTGEDNWDWTLQYSSLKSHTLVVRVYSFSTLRTAINVSHLTAEANHLPVITGIDMNSLHELGVQGHTMVYYYTRALI